MSTALQPVDLTGAMVGTTGSIDLSQVIGPGGISYAQTGQGTLRLHNESNCGLLCSFDNSIQSFNLPAGGWSDSYPKSSDDALNFTVLYTLSGPGVTLLLSTYYYPGEPVPAITTLGNSPIGGGNVQTNFSSLVNTGNNPGTSIINVQPNDATSPTWSADNSGNLTIKGDNAGILTLLLQLIAGANPSVNIDGTIFSNGGNITLPNNMTLMWKDNGGTSRIILFGTSGNSVVLRAMAGASGNRILLQDETGATQLTVEDVSPQVRVANNLGVSGALVSSLTPVTFAGSAGSANLYQWLQGNVQMTLVVFKAFSTAVSSFSLALPTAYTVGAFVRTGNIGNFALECLHSSAVQNINVFTGLSSGGGSVANQGGIFAYSLGEVPHAFDTLNFASGGTESNITGFALIEGE